MEVLKAEIEDQVKKILKLVENKENGITNSELVGLINNFHDQYQSLYSQCNRLKGESGKKSRVRKDKGLNYSPYSSSDSDYYSSEEIEINTHDLTNSDQKTASRFEQELKIADLMNKLMSTTEENEALNLKYQETLSKLQETEIMNKKMRDEEDERQREISALVNEHGSQESAQIKELEGQLSSIKLELGSLLDQKRVLEAQCATKANEARQLGEKNKEPHSQVSKLELISKEKGNEVSEIEDLKSQVCYLQQEVDSLHASKEQAAEQVRALVVQVDVMKQDLVSLTSQKNDLELLLEEKTREISEYLIQVKTLKEELAKKTEVEYRMLKEKQGFPVPVKDLDLDMESLCNQKKKQEEHIDIKNNDGRQLREENERLHAKLSLTENELSALKRKFEDREKEASSQNLALEAKADDLQQQLDKLQVKKSELNSQIVGEKQECLKTQTELEQQNSMLTDNIADQQKIIKNQEDIIKNLTEESKKAKCQILGSKTSLQIAERKMSELAEHFRKRLEDNIRVLFRRIQVAEQLQNETKDSYKKTLEQLEEAHRLLIGKGLSRKTRDMLEPGQKAMSRMESVAKRLEANGELSNRLSKMSDELVLAKTWVTETKNYKKRLQEQVQSLVEKLDDKEEQVSLLREEVSNLEAKLGKQGGDRLNMIKTSSDLEKKVGELENRIKKQDAELSCLGELENRIKEQDAELLSLGEEKREAIRQLCLFIDYHRTGCDYLKAEIAKIARSCKIKT